MGTLGVRGPEGNHAGNMREIEAVTEAVNEALPALARDVIRAHLDLADPDTESFLRYPDARDQHQTRWHQWGILTHTRMFLLHFDSEVPRLLREWDLWDAIKPSLDQDIDGATKWDLLRISVLLHDIGKFAARRRGRSRFHFTDHERLSGSIIRQTLHLEQFGLTPDQIEYIALTAEDHFVLGLVRKQSRELGEYDERFARSAAFDRIAAEIRGNHPADFVEIGILFLGDSLAKANPGEGPPDALGQHAINVIVARHYLEDVLSCPR